MLQSKMLEYVSSLENPYTRQIYTLCQRILTESADTLDDDFHIAAKVDDVFKSFAERYHEFRT